MNKDSRKGRFFRLVLSVMMVLSMCFSLSGCSSPSTDKVSKDLSSKSSTDSSAKKTYNVVFSVAGLNHPLFAENKKRLEAEAKAQGVNLSVLDAQLNTAKQVSDLEDAITKNPDLIVLIPNDSQGVVPVVEKINAAKIPLVVAIRKIASGDSVAFVGCDDVVAGKTAGNYIATLLKGEGNVVEIMGTLGSTTTNERSSGFNSVIDTYPGLKVVAKQTAKFQRGEALNVMQNIIQSNPSIDAVFAHNDEMAGGVVEALKAAGITDVIVIGDNATSEAMQRIEEGSQSATITFPADMAKEAFKLGLDYLNGKTTTQNYTKLLSTDLITKQNVEAFKQEGY